MSPFLNLCRSKLSISIFHLFAGKCHNVSLHNIIETQEGAVGYVCDLFDLGFDLQPQGVGASHLGNHGSATGESVVQSPFDCLLWSTPGADPRFP